MTVSRAVVLLIVVLLSTRVPAQPATQSIITRTTFEKRSDLGLWPEMARRFQWRGQTFPEPYKIAEQSFEVYLPPVVEGKKRGLLVWINSDDSGVPPKGWLPVLDKHRLAWIGANGSGNEHPPAWRFALAIDAAENARQRYDIDAERVYVVGLSGGGRCASMVAPMYPDVFRGGMYIVGCDYFEPLPVPDEPGMVWRQHFRRPPEELLKLAQKRSRIVLLTGEKDPNRPQTLSTYQSGYVKDGFEHVTYLEVPGMGHELPDAAWFEKGVEALEKRER